MSLEGTDRYLSPYENLKRERDYVNIFLPRDTLREQPEPSPGHCPIHNARYIDWNSGSNNNNNNDFRCPICGYKKPVEVLEKPKEEKQQQQVIKKKNPVKAKKAFAISQTSRNNNKKAKSPGQIEIEKELGGRSEVSSYEEWDL